MNNQSGFVAVSVAVMLVAISIVIGTTVTLLSIGEGQSALALYKGEENLAFVEGCVEDVLLKIRADNNFSQDTITRPEGSCSIVYNQGGPVNWDIEVTSSTTDYKRTVQVIFRRNATGISLDCPGCGWEEI